MLVFTSVVHKYLQEIQVTAEEIHMAPDNGLKALNRIGNAFGLGGYLIGQLVHHLLHHGGKEFLLGREIAVDGALAHAQFIGNHLYVSQVVTVPGKDITSRLNDLPAPLFPRNVVPRPRQLIAAA